MLFFQSKLIGYSNIGRLLRSDIYFQWIGTNYLRAVKKLGPLPSKFVLKSKVVVVDSFNEICLS
uniref:Uncharacterized protein n=1 Tax=Manihot esculenta TaxID=3983 RepID=A0A2C9WMP2_MANES